MEFNSILRSFPWILLIYLNLFIQKSQTYDYDRRHRYYPFYDRPADDHFDTPVPEYRSHYQSQPEYRSHYHSQPEYESYFRSQPEYYPDEQNIKNFADIDDDSPKPRKMLKISDLNDMKHSHGSGQKKDAMTEERVDSQPVGIQMRTRKEKDSLGKTLSESDCGESTELAQRIVGGTDATEGSHPWIVAILKNGEAWCGGTIINSQWIVTASHCFMGDQTPESFTWAIRVGTINRNSGQTYKIGKVITHERFNNDNMLNSDIALMKTTKPIKYTHLIKPVCLPDNSYDEPRATRMIVAGWGAVAFDNDNLPVILQDLILNLIKDSDCAQKYKQKKYSLYKSQLCTWNYKQDACQGDSGGPLVEIVNGKATLVGVVSYGSTCADDYPGVYTQVSYFLKWIKTITKDN